MQIETIGESDLADIEELEKKTFSNPWSLQSLRFLLADVVKSGCVRNEEGKVIAYGGMMCAGDDGEILNIAVEETMQRQGIGRSLMQYFLKTAQELNLQSVSLEVRESNSPAIGLYDSLGFEKVGTIKNYYTKPKENALLMAVKLGKGGSD